MEIILLENVPNKEALQIYKQAGLVIDQVLASWWGGFAEEATKRGKPVCLFIREEDLKFIPEMMAKDLRNAIINMKLFHIENVLKEYLQNPQLLYREREAGFEYVHKWHDPIYVAGITKEVYEKRVI
jgi:hypothetical protein